MPKVTFLPSGIVAEYAGGALSYGGHGRPGSLLDVARRFEVPLEHTCGGNGACTSCHVVIRSGERNLSPMEDREDERLLSAANLTLRSRLACQCVVEGGDVMVEVPRSR